MLTHLRITNFALLEELEMDLGAGLTLLTGETGAGKSILIDAICRILGARAAQDDIRSGANKAVLETIFDAASLPAEAKALLQEWQIDLEEGNLIVRREISSSGKSRSLINNCSVTLQQLRHLSPHLIDLFGQNEHQSLLDRQSQQRMYDAAIGIQDQVRQLGMTAAEIQSLQNEWKMLQQREQQREREIDLLRFQIREIEEANISEQEEQEWNARKLLLQNSERVHSLCESLLETILEKDYSLTGLMKEVERNAQELQRYKPELGEFSSRFAEWQAGLEDFVQSVHALQRSLDFEQGSLDELENRLDLLQRLKKKYGPTIPDVLQHLAQARQDLDADLHAEEREEELVGSIQNAVARYETLANGISELRESERESFEHKMETELQQVAMEQCHFRIRLESSWISEQTAEITDRTYPMHGWESVAFEMEPNPGEGFRELGRIASGGELSRLMLALKVVYQKAGEACSLIFDEIDAGIGGRVAYRIGERLKRLSQGAQVLCVTHLPQVAAFGDHHFRVVKTGRADRTITVVEELNETDRVQELARMLSGSEVTEAALQHARELRDQIGAQTS